MKENGLHYKNMFEILKTIESALRSRFKSQIKTFVIGDPVLIPESNLPCIAVVPVTTSITIADVSRDLATHSIEVILIINAKNELSGKANQIVGTEFLTETMEQVDSVGNLSEHSILSVIRENLRIESNLEIANENTIDYGIEMRGEQFFTREARLRFDVMRINTRP